MPAGEDGTARSEWRERRCHVECARVAVRHVLLERLHDHVGQLVREVGPDHLERQRRVRKNGGHVALVTFAGERPAGPEQTIQHHAERPDVSPAIHATVADLFGRHVRRRSERALPVVGEVRRGGGLDLGDAEVEDLRDALACLGLGEKDVRRLQIAMHDAVVVGLLQTEARLDDPVDERR